MDANDSGISMRVRGRLMRKAHVCSTEQKMRTSGVLLVKAESTTTMGTKRINADSSVVGLRNKYLTAHSSSTVSSSPAATAHRMAMEATASLLKPTSARSTGTMPMSTSSTRSVKKVSSLPQRSAMRTNTAVSVKYSETQPCHDSGSQKRPPNTPTSVHTTTHAMASAARVLSSSLRKPSTRSSPASGPAARPSSAASKAACGCCWYNGGCSASKSTLESVIHARQAAVRRGRDPREKQRARRARKNRAALKRPRTLPSMRVVAVAALVATVFTLVRGGGAFNPRAVFDAREAVDAEALRREVLDMFQHGYSQYMRLAFPHDELAPLSCGWTDHFKGLAVTVIDSLSTLAVLGRREDFTNSVDYVLHRFAAPGHFDVDANVSVFETNIRLLGGLLRCVRACVWGLFFSMLCPLQCARVGEQCDS